jgi:hypothetical protein
MVDGIANFSRRHGAAVRSWIGLSERVGGAPHQE